ncbi:hypothetical protein RRG08_049298 [Elysia crispata]|uniref:Uncharacterized protein n=1 Tax=Elysia crispata TaxID=231223 RepID=A0AAE1B235_9GAST|nr:hypothetical protein RRG08_049298 [Elysia crispata]
MVATKLSDGRTIELKTFLKSWSSRNSTSVHTYTKVPAPKRGEKSRTLPFSALKFRSVAPDAVHEIVCSSTIGRFIQTRA